MGASHLKRLNAPKTWKIKRRGIKFVTRPSPGPHTIEQCMPLNLVLRDMLSYAKTSKEVKTILLGKGILIDGKVVKRIDFPVGIMDVIEIQTLNEQYRMLLNEKGYLTLKKIDKKEANLKPCKIIKKTIIKKGKIQLNLSFGFNLLAEKNMYATGDTLMLDMPSKNIISHFTLDKGAYIYLIGGKHIGEQGVVDSIKANSVFYKTPEGQVVETLKKYALVVGKEKTQITLI